MHLCVHLGFIVLVFGVCTANNVRQNLVQNPSCEGTGSWSDGLLRYRKDTNLNLNPVQGDKICGIDPAIGVTAIRQDIDVSVYADNTPFLFSVYVAGSANPAPGVDYAVTVTNTAASTTLLAVHTWSGSTSWEKFSQVIKKEPGENTIRITFQGDSSFYWDAVHLAANLVENPSFETGEYDGVYPNVADIGSTQVPLYKGPVGWGPLFWTIDTQALGGAVTPKHGERLLSAVEGVVLTQEIKFGGNTGIGEGSSIVIDTYWQGNAKAQPDSGLLFAYWVTSGGPNNVVGTASPLITFSPDLANPPIEWTQRRVQEALVVPAGVTAIRLDLKVQAGGSNTNVEIFLDDLFVGPDDRRMRTLTSVELPETHIAFDSVGSNVVVNNDGVFGDLVIFDIAIDDPSPDNRTTYSYTGASQIIIKPSSSGTIPVRVATNGQLVAGDAALQGTLTFSTNDPANSNPSVDLTVHMVDQTFTMSPETGLDFDQQHKLLVNGGTTRDRTLTISNTGGNGRTALQIGVDLTNLIGAPGFSAAGVQSSYTIPAGQTRDLVFSYNFQNTAPNNYTTSIVLTTNDPSQTSSNIEVSLMAVVGDYNIDIKGHVQFGNVHVGSLTKPTLDIAIKNTGTVGYLKIDSIDLADVAVDKQCTENMNMCLFPFVYDGNVYTSCMTPSGETGEWCPTQVGGNNVATFGQMEKCAVCSDVMVPSKRPDICTESGLPCVFPFFFNGKRYDNCNDEDPDTPAWCSTEVNDNWEYISTKWSTCTSCPEDAICIADNEPECQFPFIWNGKIYYECVEDISSSWCSHQVDGNGEHIAGNETQCVPCTESGNLERITKTNELCMFPFKFDGTMYNDCTLTNVGGGDLVRDGSRLWCATAVDPTSRDIVGDNWGLCASDDSPPDSKCTASGRCQFPFEFEGRTYWSCTQAANKAGDDVWWCPTTVDGDNVATNFLACTECTDNPGGTEQFQVVAGLVTSNDNVRIGPGETHIVTIEFDPLSVVDSVSAAPATALDITINTPNNPNVGGDVAVLRARGEGIDNTANGSPYPLLNFGQVHISVAAGETLLTQLIVNEGFRSRSYIDTLTLPTSGRITAKSDPMGAKPHLRLPPGTSASVLVGFTASDGVGEFNAAMSWKSNDHLVKNERVEIEAISADFELDTVVTELNFPDTHITEGTSAPLTVSLTNKGTYGILTIQQLTLDGSDFNIISGNTETEIRPGHTNEVEINFNPATAATEKTGTLTYLTDSKTITTPQTVTLKGRAIDTHVTLESPSTTPLDFGTRDTQDDPSAAQDIVILNDGTVGELKVSQVSLGGNNYDITQITRQGSPVSSVTQTSPLILNPTERMVVSVAFDPQHRQVGTLTTDVTVDNNHYSQGTYTVGLTGVGIHPNIQPSLFTVNFGDWDQDAGPIEFMGRNYRELVVTNNGDTDLVITDVSLAGDAVINGFSITAVITPVTLSPGQNVTVECRWDPLSTQDNGEKTTTLIIQSNDFDRSSLEIDFVGQATVPLQGSGTAEFIPPFNGQYTEALLEIQTSKQGLPQDGQLCISFPEGFEFREPTNAYLKAWVWKSGEQTETQMEFSHEALNIQTDKPCGADNTGRITATINTGNSPNLPAISAGEKFKVRIKGIKMPSPSDCLNLYTPINTKPMTWNIETQNPSGNTLEYLHAVALQGAECVDGKTFTINLPDEDNPETPPYYYAGQTLEIMLELPPAAIQVIELKNLPLKMDTNPATDKLMIVPFGTECTSEIANDIDDPNLITDNLGPADQTEQITAEFTTRLSAGEYSLCYRRGGGSFEWEIIGEKGNTDNVKIVINPKGPVGDPKAPLTPYQPVGIPAPRTFTKPSWQSFKPKRAIAGEPVKYSFTGGILSGGAQNVMVKLAYGDVDCVGDAGDDAVDELAEDNTAILTADSSGLYRMCINYRNDWEPIEGLVSVMKPSTDNNLLFYGYSTCEQFQNGMDTDIEDLCGCFLGARQTVVITMRDSVSLMDIAEANVDEMTYNMGCCKNKCSARQSMQFEGVTWGYCTSQTSGECGGVQP